MMISIVIPCYQEAENLPLLVEGILMNLSDLGHEMEIICVDDGSSDGTFEVIQSLRLDFPEVKGIKFSRNFGHQIALLAGLEKAKGDVVITMDGDMQHPPEVLPLLIQKYTEGYDIVNTSRVYPNSASWFKKLSSRYFYSVLNSLSEVEIEPNSADFRLMSRQCVDAFLSLEEHDRFTRGLIKWIGFSQTSVKFTAGDRFAGQSTYTLGKMIKFALNGLTSMSSKPLRFSLYLGLLFLIFGFFYGFYILLTFVKGENVAGWTSILITVLILGGVQLLILSIIGEYIARIFNESKRRPLYLIKKEEGF